MAQCEWQHGLHSCPREAETDGRLCIFHMPTGKRGKSELVFWRHFANYYLAQCADLRLGHHAVAVPWIEGVRDEELLRRYSGTGWHEGSLDYRGFVFPVMDHTHNLQRFVFAACDFTAAQFSKKPASEDIENQPAPQRQGGVDGAPALNEPPIKPIEEDATSAADFGHARFLDDAVFTDANFLGHASFSSAVFKSKANFYLAEFTTGVDCTGAHFEGRLDIRTRTLDGKADFSGAIFDARADFGEDVFTGNAVFKEAKFASEAEFSGVHFESDADFTRAEFNGPADFRRTHIAGPVLFQRATLQETLTFEQLSFQHGGVLLLWGLNYARGRSSFTVADGSRRGEITESAAGVVLRDMPTGIDRVSFLRSDVYYDHPVIRFSNVLWEPKARPRGILHDAGFVYHRVNDWAQHGLGTHMIELAGLFNQEPWSDKLEDAVRKDVERIVREIRRAHEDFAGYSDAGDFHIAEMAYRQKRTGPSLYKGGLFLYWLFSKYGESPSRALKWLLGTWAVAAIVYMFTGFCFPVRPIRYVLVPEYAGVGAFIRDFFLRAMPFAFVNLFASYFRNMAQASTQPHVTFGTTVALSVIETTLGIVSLTLFVLAVRRRFRR